MAELTTPPPNTTIPTAAPKAAPWDTPSVEAEASGFRRTHCITAPALARAAPTRMAATTRGRRIFKTAVRAISSPPPSSTRMTSGMEMGIEPTPTAYSATTMAAAHTTAKAVRFLRR